MFGFSKKKVLKLRKVMEGEIVDISEVPDAVFSQKMLGDGFAVKPTEGEVRAPVSGRIIQIFPTNHAFGILTEDGIEVLVHIGIDTVELKGEGFTRVMQVNQYVNEGDTIIQVDLALVASKGKSIVTPVVITSKDKVRKISVHIGSGDEYAAVAELV